MPKSKSKKSTRKLKKIAVKSRSIKKFTKKYLLVFALLTGIIGAYYLGNSNAGVDININPTNASTCPTGLYPGVLNILSEESLVAATTPEEAVAGYLTGGLIPNLPLRSWIKHPVENENTEEVYKINVAGLPYMISIQKLDSSKWAVDKIFRCS